MFNFVGLKTSIISLFCILLSFVLVYYVPNLLGLLSSITKEQLFLLLAISFLFSCQFNHSRFALVLGLFALVFGLNEQLFTLPKALTWSPEILTLTVIFFFGMLPFFKDRSLFSVHLFSRIALFGLAYLFAMFWQEGLEHIETFVAQFPIYQSIAPFLLIELPFCIVITILLVKSLRTSHLLYPAMLACVLVWYLSQNKIIGLSWQVSMTVLVVYMLASVIASSYFLAYRDELTGLPSRRALNQLALSLGRKYCIAMMDVDHFKKFNDTYGHDIGDQVLKLVAAKLKQVRAGGRVFRYGGEEFTVVFSRKNAQQVFDELDKLRQSIADYQMVIRQDERKSKTKKDRQGKKGGKSSEKAVSVTISIGASDRQKGQSFEQVLKAADQNLYKAKKRGRDNVTI